MMSEMSFIKSIVVKKKAEDENELFLAENLKIYLLVRIVYDKPKSLYVPPKLSFARFGELLYKQKEQE